MLFIMKIITWHGKTSAPITSWEEIQNQAKELRDLTNSHDFEGYYRSAFALHHSQASDEPKDFFTIAKDFEDKLGFGSWIVMNPIIIKKNRETAYFIQEGCMSYPFRKFKRTLRYNEIEVEYQIPAKNLLGKMALKKVTKKLYTQASEVFQHETDHGKGKTIYS